MQQAFVLRPVDHTALPATLGLHTISVILLPPKGATHTAGH